MANPYIHNKEQEPTPEPSPAPIPAKVNLVYVAIVIAVAGLFLPPAGGWDWDKLKPEPPPYVEPGPGPGPSPSPLVDPSKTLGAWVVVVDQTESRTPAVAKVLNDTKFWKSLETRGLNWRHYDADSPDAKLYLPAAKAVGMPALFVVGGQGELLSKVLKKAPLPATTSALDTLIKEATAR